jgi:putative drug exporter of the RND superfamily
MASRFSIEGLAASSARHPWRVVAIWILILVIGGGYAASSLADVLTNEMTISGNVETIIGAEKLRDSTLADEGTAAETIVVRSVDPSITVDDEAFAEKTNEVVNAVRALHGEWIGSDPLPPPSPLALASGALEGATVINYFELRQFNDPQIEALRNEDGTVVLIPVTFDRYEGGVPIREYIDRVEEFDDPQFDVTTIGNLSINDEFQEIVIDDLIKAEAIGIPIAILVLVIVFGALVAPVIPLTLGVFSVGIALGIVTLLGQFQSLQLFIQNMVTMLGLAIGIDYSLFIIERYREQRTLGYSKQRSIEIAGGTAGKAVMFSGLTVILALIGVMFVGINIFFSLGLGAVIVVSIAVLMTMTILPAMLSLLGDRINWPRRNYRSASAIEHDEDVYSGFWGRLTKIVVARPWVSLILSVGVLLGLASPVLDLETGFTGSAQLPPGEMSIAYGVLESDFSAGLLSPIEIIIEGERTDELDAAIEAFRTQLEEDGRFSNVDQTLWDEEAGIALVEGTLAFSGSSPEAYEVVEELREDMLPETVGQVPGVETYVSGQSAGETDMLGILDRATPLVLAFVLSLSFILLTLAFRSVVVPIKAIIYNLLSVGAAWGIMVMVFANGVARDLLGYTASPVIESWLPILLFCILFGLSMDYHVFILSRIREHYDISQDNAESVAVGLRSTGRIITGAALIMVVIFGAFSTGSMLALQQLGFGLAVAVALDATIIRSVLVPSLMTIVGDTNWWLPKWLEWLPDIRIEGKPPEPPMPDEKQQQA